MVGRRDPKLLPSAFATNRRTALGLLLGAPLLGACAGVSNPFTFGAGNAAGAGTGAAAAHCRHRRGQGRACSAVVGSGNAGVAAQSMKNAAEMALAEFQNPNVQLLIKDDAGNPQGAQSATQQALDEGAEIILGPLFARRCRRRRSWRAPAAFR